MEMQNKNMIFNEIGFIGCWFKNLIKKDKMKISKKTAIVLINNNKGKFFTVTFTKKDKTERTINAVKKTGAISPACYLNVYSIQDKGYRNVDVRKISKLKLGGNTYKVR